MTAPTPTPEPSVYPPVAALTPTSEPTAYPPVAALTPTSEPTAYPPVAAPTPTATSSPESVPFLSAVSERATEDSRSRERKTSFPSPSLAPPHVLADQHVPRDRRRVCPVDGPVRRRRREALPEAPQPARDRGDRLELDGDRVRGVLCWWQLLLSVPRLAGKMLRGDRRPVVLLPLSYLSLRRWTVLPARRVHLSLSCGRHLHLKRRRRPTVAVVRLVLVAHTGGSARRVLHGVLPQATDTAAYAGRAAILRPRRAAARRCLRLPDHRADVSPERRRIRSFEPRQCWCVPTNGFSAALTDNPSPSALGAAARAGGVSHDDLKTDGREDSPREPDLRSTFAGGAGLLGGLMLGSMFGGGGSGESGGFDADSGGGTLAMDGGGGGDFAADN